MRGGDGNIHGVGTARAVRIFKTYGADAIQVMTENPYRLARDIRGIGFKTADAIAMKLGIEKTAMTRVRAGISYALAEALAGRILTASEGVLGEIVTLVTMGAAVAVTSGEEAITEYVLDRTGFVAPSRRKRIAV